MDSTARIDERILSHHAKFHPGAFINCQQCRDIIDMTDEFAFSMESIRELPSEYALTPKRGRPPEKPMPERIDASPEEIADAILSMPPKKTWRYEEEERRRRANLDR